MPRFDDRLANVLELMRSSEHSNIDTIFRHISDILLQDGAWMAPSRRASVVEHLADTYPKTSQPARMEVMDITARVSDAAPEIAALAAADTSIIGTRLWDRVQLAGDDWDILLPRLPKPILGRLRSRLDLPDETVVAIDREWRTRVKAPSYTAYTLEETAETLKQGIFRSIVDQDEDEPTDNIVILADGEDDALDVGGTDDAAPQTALANNTRTAGKGASLLERASQPLRGSTLGNTDVESALPVGKVAADDTAFETGIDLTQEEPTTSLFLPSVEDRRAQDGDGEDAQTADEAASTPEDLIDVSDFLPQDEAEEAALDDAAAEDTPSTPADIIDFFGNRPADDDTAQGQADAQADGADEDAQVTGLGENPQVEDPKIQDILERLREFGSRSKRFVEDDVEDEDAEAQDAQIENALISLASAASSGDESLSEESSLEESVLDDSDQDESVEDDAVDLDKRASGVSMFLPQQPEEEEDRKRSNDAEQTEDAPESFTFGTARDTPLHQPLTVNGNVWVADRLGTLVECNTDQDDAFGILVADAEGQILASLFDDESAHTLNRALHARRPFRDISLKSTADGKIWMISAVAVFDDVSGIFLGHRGTAVSLSITAAPAPDITDDDALFIAEPQTLDTLDIASLAHELKTPLNAIRGFAEMIETQQLGPASAFARDRSRKISQEADQLHQVLGDLLLLSNREQSEGSDPRPLRSLLKNALAPFEAHLTLIGLDTLGPQLGTRVHTALLETVLEKMIHLSALWTPARRDIKVTITRDSQTALSMHVPLAGWMGGSGAEDLKELEAGPRLSYRHPLLNVSFKGRGLQAIMDEINAADTRIFLRRAGRLEAAVVLVLPIE